MSVVTKEEFQDALDSEFAWRQKELSSILSEATTAPAAVQPLRLRTGVALLYAHWEGFIKTAADMYIRHVAVRKLRPCDLNDGLRALVLRPEIHKCAARDDVQATSALISLLTTGLGSRARFAKDAFTKRIANLTASEFRRVIHSLGLEHAKYSGLTDSVINNDLVGRRNNIAHGQWLCPELDDFCRLHSQVTAALRTFKDQLQNAASLGEYKARGKGKVSP